MKDAFLGGEGHSLHVGAEETSGEILVVRTKRRNGLKSRKARALIVEFPDVALTLLQLR